MMEKKRKKFRLGLLLGLAILALTACNSSEAKNQEKEVYETSVAVANVFTGSLSGDNQMTGVAEAAVDIQVLPKAVGQLVEVYVENGDVVKENQVLAQIDDRDQQLALKGDKIKLTQAENGLKRAQNGLNQAQNNYHQAKVALKQAQSNQAEAKQGRDYKIANLKIDIANLEKQWHDAKINLERMKELLAEGLISEQQFEEAQAAESRLQNSYEQAKLSLQQAKSELSLTTVATTVEQANINLQVAEASIRDAEIGVKDAQASLEQVKIAVELSEKRLEETKIKAPTAGEITALSGKKGEFVSNQAPFARILAAKMIDIDVSISAEQLLLFKEGQKVEVNFAGLQKTKTKTGKVTYISSTADQSGLFNVEIQVENTPTQIRPGMIATVLVEEMLVNDSLIVPTAAVVELQGESFVFVVDGKKAVQKEVKVLRYDTDHTAITGDVPSDAKVVVKGQNLLNDGDTVKIVKEEN